MITNGLFFLIGGLSVILILFFLRKRAPWLKLGKGDKIGSDDSVEIAFLLNSLKARGELQDKLFAHLPVGVLLLNEGFEVLSSNQLGLLYLKNLDPEFDQINVLRLGEKTKYDLIQHTEGLSPIELFSDSKDQKVYEVQLQKVQTVEGQYWILMVADVTEEKDTQHRLQVQDRLATLGQFAAGIAHDFNNILSAIQIYLDVILRDPQISESNKTRIDAIKDQSERAVDLIGQILDFSRNRPLKFKTIDLIAFMLETREILARILPDNIQINQIFPEQMESIWISGDPTRLQQVLINLGLNSRDAMPDGGIITIILDTVTIKEEEFPAYANITSGEWVSIQVKDNGIGIPPRDQSRIFEPFFTTKSSQGGTGLGLAQVYGIITQHGGLIDLRESIPGRGTTFQIYLPYSDQELPTTPHPSADIDIDGQERQILIVEDEPSLRNALVDIFEHHNFRVIQAEDGEEGLVMIDKFGEKTSLVISDVVMPNIGGIEFFQKARDSFPEMRFLFITAHPEMITGELIDQDPLTRMLLKPFSLNDILVNTRDILSLES